MHLYILVSVMCTCCTKHDCDWVLLHTLCLCFVSFAHVCACDVTTVPAAGAATEEEVEAYEQTISELEKRCEALEDDVRNTESERDLVSNENQVIVY